MPLLDIVGFTACNKTLFAGFWFISNENEESYRFLLDCLISVLEQAEIRHPETVLTDKEKNLMNAIKQGFHLLETSCAYGVSSKTFFQTSGRKLLQNPTASQISTTEVPESTQREHSQHEYILAEESLG